MQAQQQQRRARVRPYHNAVHVLPDDSATNTNQGDDVQLLLRAYDHALNSTIKQVFNDWIRDDGLRTKSRDEVQVQVRTQHGIESPAQVLARVQASRKKLNAGIAARRDASQDWATKEYVDDSDVNFDAFHNAPWEVQRRVFRRMERKLRIQSDLHATGYEKGTSPFWMGSFKTQVVSVANRDRKVQDVLVELLQKLLAECRPGVYLVADGIKREVVSQIDMNIVALLKMALPTFQFLCRSATAVCRSEAQPDHKKTTEACTSLLQRLRFEQPEWDIFLLFDHHVRFAFGCPMMPADPVEYVPCGAPQQRLQR